MLSTISKRLLLALCALAAWQCVLAEDTLKLAIGQRGNWENAAPELGQKAGFFKKRGLNLELLYTQGAGETMQAVISGSVDIGVGVGTAGVLGAFAQGRASARHRQLDDRRRRPVLVRARRVPDQEHQGRGRQDDRILDQRLIDEPRGARLHTASSACRPSRSRPAARPRPSRRR